MNEEVFNTLAAVALMCSVHFHSAFTMSGPIQLDQNGRYDSRSDGKYDPGFEQCSIVVKAHDAEVDRRAKVVAEKELASDKARVANAIAALHGKNFTPERAPVVPNLLQTNSCVVPAVSSFISPTPIPAGKAP